MASSSESAALDAPRWLYLDAALGWSNTKSFRLDSSDAKMSFDQGVFQPSLALGIQTPHLWRFELERVVHQNAPEILYSSAARIESDSDEADEFRSTSLMFNASRDFEVGDA
ncbi:MAG: hypothetical protein FJ194_19170, partial [Gammaproteobacteria bacterium]|nr:hypothetical protein [Gammaproteobacteria bacterium]